jgi:hypothetical protein
MPSQRSVTHQLIQHWAPYAQLRQQFSGTRQMEQLSLHCPQKIVATEDSSALREEMRALEPQEDNTKARNLIWKPMSWLGHLSSRGPEAAWVLPLNGGRRSSALLSAYRSLFSMPSPPNLTSPG